MNGVVSRKFKDQAWWYLHTTSHNVNNINGNKINIQIMIFFTHIFFARGTLFLTHSVVQTLVKLTGFNILQQNPQRTIITSWFKMLFSKITGLPMLMLSQGTYTQPAQGSIILGPLLFTTIVYSRPAAVYHKCLYSARCCLPQGSILANCCWPQGSILSPLLFTSGTYTRPTAVYPKYLY